MKEHPLRRDSSRADVDMVVIRQETATFKPHAVARTTTQL
jgi:hypothetical protein